MSRADIVALLGKPYGEASYTLVYFEAGADTILAVQPNESGDCKWLLLGHRRQEFPRSFSTTGFGIHRVARRLPIRPRGEMTPIRRATGTRQSKA
jgi:hypothetical protein